MTNTPSLKDHDFNSDNICVYCGFDFVTWGSNRVGLRNILRDTFGWDDTKANAIVNERFPLPECTTKRVLQ